MINAHGLARNIPDSIKREVRQRDGFGCILCGNAIIEYEHFDPVFSEAIEHKAAGITILCGQCHNKKTRGMLSIDAIRKAVSNPKCMQSGFSFEAFDVGGRHPSIILGNLEFQEVFTIIRVLGEDILSTNSPEFYNSPYRISAKITDLGGKTIFEIKDNEWRTPSNNWDVELSGRHIKIRKGPRNIALVIRSEPPNVLVVERIHMFHKGTLISGREGCDLIVKNINGTEMVAQGAVFIGCQIGIDVGLFDLKLGVGGGTVMIKSMKIGSGPRISSLPSATTGVPRMSRNSLCWCGSHLKFKKCHGRLPQL